MAWDKESIRQLEELGWKVILVWECELKNMENLSERLVGELTGK